MRAITQAAYGTADLLRLTEVDRPTPRADEVLIRVRASSVNFGDHARLTGRPWLLRLVEGLRRPKNPILGRDVTGVVEAVGAEVTAFAPGDAVYGEIPGAYAEYVCATTDHIARKPTRLGFEEAAALPVAGLTALQGLRDHAGVQPGHRVLINGASGGVGTFAVQVAKALGAHVTAVCSARNVEQARALGADEVIDYAREDFTARAETYDAIFDLAGAPLGRCLRRLTPTGVYVSSCGRLGHLLGVALRGLWSKRVRTFMQTHGTAELEALAALVDAGAITPAIERRYALADAPEALRNQATGRARAKSTIRI